MNTNVKPKYQAKKLDGTLMRRIAKPKTDNKGKLLGGFEYEDVEQDAGWMVYFPSGASIHIWTKEEMERQGFLLPAPLVDMETGDTVAPTPEVDLEALSEQKTSRSRSSKVAQT